MKDNLMKIKSLQSHPCASDEQPHYNSNSFNNSHNVSVTTNHDLLATRMKMKNWDS